MACYHLLYYLRCSCGSLATLLLCTCIRGICLLFCSSIPAAGQLHVPEEITSAPLHVQHDFSNYDTSGILKLFIDSLHLQDAHSDEAVAFFEDLLFHSRKINYGRGAGMALYAIGNIYTNKGMYLRSAEVFRAAAAIFREYKIENLLGQVYNNLANAYKIQGYTQLSAYYYYLSLRIAYNTQDSSSIPHICYNLATVFKHRGQGLYYLERAEPLAKKYKQYHLLGLILIAKTNKLQDKKEWEQVEAKLDEVMLLGQTHELTDILYQVNLQYASLNIQKEKPDQALQYLNKAKKILDQLSAGNRQYHFGMGNWYGMMGSVLFNLKQYHESKSYLTRAIEITTQMNIKNQMSEAHKLMSFACEYTGNYAKALAHQRTHQEIQDSLMNETVIRSINDLEVKYRTAEKDQELIRKQLELEQRNVLISGITLGFILLIAGSVVYYRHIRQKQKLLRQQQEIEQLKALMTGEEKERNRIARELHDGIMVRFSSVKMNLGALMKYMPDIPQTKALQDTITQLDDATHELRTSAHNLMPDMLLRSGLSAAIRYFCNSLLPDETTEIRFQQYGSPPAFMPEYELMLYRIVQELIQNALKYAEANRIIVQLDHTGDLFTITVEDEGKGFDPAALAQTPGSGLNSIRSRIKAIGGITEVQSAPGKGTTVYIELEVASLQTS